MPTIFGSSSLAGYSYSIYCEVTTLPIDEGITPVEPERPPAELMQKSAEVIQKSAEVVQEAVSIVDAEVQDQFLMYPNPTNGEVTVTWNNTYEGGLILNVLNSTGQIMQIEEIQPDWNQIELDLGDYSAGMYYIQISDPSEAKVIHQEKVVKSR